MEYPFNEERVQLEISRRLPTLKQKIVTVWKCGAPREPGRADELRSWVEAYFPGEYKTESINRIAQMLREVERDS